MSTPYEELKELHEELSKNRVSYNISGAEWKIFPPLPKKAELTRTEDGFAIDSYDEPFDPKKLSIDLVNVRGRITKIGDYELEEHILFLLDFPEREYFLHNIYLRDISYNEASAIKTIKSLFEQLAAKHGYNFKSQR